MPLADWSVPFELTSAVYTGSTAITLPLNQPITNSGIFLLRPDGCTLQNQVRAQKVHAPQEDGDVFSPCRYVAGMEMNLAIQLWQDDDKIACDELLQEMLDTLMGYLYGLLNAPDNYGRISWLPTGFSSPTSDSRMLDDIRLWTYPAESQQPGEPYEIAVTLDCELPYAEDLTQLSVGLSGTPTAVTNAGNRPTFPVWRLDGPFSFESINNTTTGQSISYSDGQPGAPVIGAGDILEIDTFKNTATKIAPGPVLSNAAAGIEMLTSEFYTLPPGSSNIELGFGSTGTALINAAWA